MIKSRSMGTLGVYRILANPFCKCWCKIRSKPWEPIIGCECGEEFSNICEWRWEMPDSTNNSWVVMCPEQKQVTFHPDYTRGTAAVRGDTPFVLDYHYYWEVKMLTETYGIDIMVGVGTKKVNVPDCLPTYTSFLGRNNQSYGLSHTGAIQHGGISHRDVAGFCKGSIIGVKVDLWQGTLEYFVNRKSIGVSFDNLRSHSSLYPIICSSASKSAMRLIYASSWKASLLVNAAKILAASAKAPELPPGLRRMMNNEFWMMLPSKQSPDLADLLDPQPLSKEPNTSESDSSDESPVPLRKKYFL